MPSWPAVGIHRLSVPSGADAKTHAAQGGEGAGGDTPPAEKSYIGLLILSTHAEIAVIWNDDDLREYSRQTPWGL